MVVVAQLVRAPGCDPGGRGFESRWPPFVCYAAARRQAAASSLIRFITSEDEDEIMPPRKSGGGRLSAAEVATLTAWINEGAVWPDGVDLAKLEDRRDHWSFKPLPS